MADRTFEAFSRDYANHSNPNLERLMKTLPENLAEFAEQARNKPTRVIGLVRHKVGDDTLYSAIGPDSPFLAMHADRSRYSSSSWISWDMLGDLPVCSVDELIWRETRKNLLEAGILPNVVEIPASPKAEPEAETKLVDCQESAVAALASI